MTPIVCRGWGQYLGPLVLEIAFSLRVLHDSRTVGLSLDAMTRDMVLYPPSLWEQTRISDHLFELGEARIRGGTSPLASETYRSNLIRTRNRKRCGS